MSSLVVREIKLSFFLLVIQGHREIRVTVLSDHISRTNYIYRRSLKCASNYRIMSESQRYYINIYLGGYEEEMVVFLFKIMLNSVNFFTV